MYEPPFPPFPQMYGRIHLQEVDPHQDFQEVAAHRTHHKAACLKVCVTRHSTAQHYKDHAATCIYAWAEKRLISWLEPYFMLNWEMESCSKKIQFLKYMIKTCMLPFVHLSKTLSVKTFWIRKVRTVLSPLLVYNVTLWFPQPSWGQWWIGTLGHFLWPLWWGWLWLHCHDYWFAENRS